MQSTIDRSKRRLGVKYPTQFNSLPPKVQIVSPTYPKRSVLFWYIMYCLKRYQPQTRHWILSSRGRRGQHNGQLVNTKVMKQIKVEGTLDDRHELAGRNDYIHGGCVEKRYASSVVRATLPDKFIGEKTFLER